MIWIGYQLSIFVVEYGLSFLEGNSVFALIHDVFLRVPEKSNVAHIIII